MDNYFTDRETLERCVDELMKQKPLPAATAEELDTLRENAITSLDNKIGEAIFGSLHPEQLEKINQLFDNNEQSPEVFKQFFSDAGIDLQQVVDNAIADFSKEFLGGENE